MSDDVSRPEFDLGAFRYAVAKYVKLLIRARWKDDPGFLSDQALKDWGLLQINDESILDNRIPSWRLLEEAAGALGVLNTEFIPRCGSGGIMVMTGDTPEIRLMDEVAFLAAWGGGGPYHNGELLTAAKRIREGHPIDWNALVGWSKLPAIRADLDMLPDPKRDVPAHSGQGAPRPPSQTPPRQFPKMDGLRWKEVTITFVSKDSVRITARSTSQVFMFSDMGFTDGRKGDRPDSQWELLKLMAQHDGKVGWKDKIPPQVKAKAKPKIKIIRNRLRAVFQIDDDPFESYRKVGSYKPKFRLADRSYAQLPAGEDSADGH